MNNQIIKQQNQQVVETRDRRIAKSMVVAMSCEIFRVDNEKETYRVQSETDVNKYYIVKFMDGTPVYCSCKDFEIQIKRNVKHICKYVRAIVLAENYGLVTTKRKKNQSPQSRTTTTIPFNLFILGRKLEKCRLLN